jgi:hypothetical protein
MSYRRLSPARLNSLPRRGLPLGLVALLLLAVPWPAPAASAQAPAGTIEEPDGADDVRLGHAQLGPPAPNAGGLDITRVEMAGESGVSLLLRITLKDAAQELETSDAISNGIIVTTCFTWDGTLYAAKVRYRLGIGVLLMTRDLGVVSGTCGPGQDVQFSKKVNIGYDVHVDLARSQVSIGINRLKLTELAGRAPAAGNVLGDLFVMINDGNRNRFDHAPEAGPSSQKLTLRFDTANQGLLAAAPVSNVPAAPCDGRVDFPAYAVEARGAQGVPIEFRNGGATDSSVSFQVNTIGGKDWKPRIVPRLSLPPAATDGKTKVTIIVSVPPGTQHKECTVLAVRGVTESGDIGETGVIVMSIVPPSRESRTLWLHTDPYADLGADCAAEHTWLNVLQTDPDDTGEDILMSPCRDPELFTWSTTTFSTRLDVNPNYDLVLNTSAIGIDARVNALVRLRSDHGEARSRLTLSLVTLRGEIVATGEREVVISTSTRDFEVPLNVGFTRDVRAEGDPSRILRSADGLAFVLRHEPRPIDSNINQAKTASTVFLVSSGTRLELPVWNTIKRNANQPGDSGGLLSLRVASVLPEFAAPSLTRVINFTVLNEGAEPDRIRVDVTVEGVKNWTTRLVPTPPFDLAPGERRTFSLGITPRAEAEESETAYIDVVAYSDRDPTARTSIAFQIKATRSGGIGGEELPELSAVTKKGGIHGPGAFALLAALGAALLLWRRR